jgi:serine/threonine protein kinase
VAVYITVPREGDRRDAVKDGAVILTKLDHPNIVKYYESYIDNVTHVNFLVMQYVDGIKLFDRVQQ